MGLAEVKIIHINKIKEIDILKKYINFFLFLLVNNISNHIKHFTDTVIDNDDDIKHISQNIKHKSIPSFFDNISFSKYIIPKNFKKLN